MNRFPESQTAGRFKGDPSPPYDPAEFQVMIVAEKFQTGFDAPLLHTMYVDKKLDGINAVQTLSRLNRTHPGKDDTFILDFVNEAEEIREAFKPFYEVTEIDAPTDPNQIYMLRTRLDQFQYYWWQEVEGFAEVFYRPKREQAATDQARLHAFVDPAVSRFKDEPDEERREAFRSLLVGYLRMYALLCQWRRENASPWRSKDAAVEVMRRAPRGPSHLALSRAPVGWRRSWARAAGACSGGADNCHRSSRGYGRDG
jgi:type I restriction enzyme R subunit